MELLLIKQRKKRLPLSPKDSASVINSLSEHVQINKEGINFLSDYVSIITVLKHININLYLQIADRINDGSLSVENFSQNEHHPKYTDPIAVDWIFVVDTLNFCFWKQEGEAGWRVDGYTGYFALCAAINRAIRVIKLFVLKH